jgi:acetyl-CoA synthetase
MENQRKTMMSTGKNFTPTPEFAEQAVAKPEIYAHAKADRLEFWAEQARALHWTRPFTEILDWSHAPVARWFDDGELNVSFNCLDRHVIAGRGDRVALYFEGEPGDRREITYAELTREVKKCANVLTDLGVVKGDRVAIYMPMIPEAIVTMLAVARLGAIHSVVFGGFSADALATRINDADVRVVVTADGGYRKGKASALKPAVDEALADNRCPTVEKVLVVKRTGEAVAWHDQDRWWHDEMSKASDEHEAQSFPSEQELFILYTSGTTGAPKGILHTSGGYLTQAAYTHRNIFDLHPETDVYWCTADIGWITGHSYVVYGPLANGASQVIYEGTPDAPHLGRWWEIIERYKVSIFYTAPTAIRTFMKLGRSIPDKFDLSSLRVLGSVGEPINPEAWLWYRDAIGGGKCPIVDTWWQTETGAIMASPLPGITTLKPGSAQTPVPGIEIKIVNDEGKEVPLGEAGLLTITEPWPSMLRGIWRNPGRFHEAYWSRFEGQYFAGDGAKWDEDGDLWLLGRVDDVMNVSGHRLSTAEIESSLVGHPWVAEAAVVGAKDEITGQAVVAFVILRLDQVEEAGEAENISRILREHVSKDIGPIARPRQILVVAELPKTRSGKIMRRLLRDVAEDRPIGDVTTLADTSVMSVISSKLAGGASD